MEAERIFHEKSKSYKPEQPVKPTDYWIAILHHEKSPHAIESGLDFLWVRGNKKITVEKLIKSYKSTAFSGPATDLDIHLCLGLSSRSLGADVNLGLLDTFADQVITLRALRNSALNAPENILRPLNPVINPATSKPSSSSDHLNKMDQKLFPSEWKLPFSPKKPHLTNNVNSEPIPMKLDNAPNQDKDDFDSWMANTLHKAETDKSSDNDEEDADSGEDDMGDDDDYHYYGGRYSHRYYSEEDMEDEEMEEEDQSEGQNDEIKHNTSFSSAPNYNALYGNATASRTIFPAMSQPVNQQAALSSYHTMHPNSATVPRIQPYESHNNGFPVLPGAAAPRPNDLSYYPVVPKVEASGDYIHSEYDNIFQRPGTIKNEDKSQVQPPVAGIKTEDQAIPDFSFDNQPNRQQMLESKQQIHNLFADASPEILEKAVKKGVDLLDLLSIPLDQKKDQSNDAAQWLTQIELVKKQAAKTRTIIGCVGATGAGKSSIINAMLDEERLVPTNCMRACTSVVTELSYNESANPAQKYRAEIDFISAADWEKELQVLFQELIDSNGNISRDCTNQETEAGVAYAKIKAVYYKMKKDDLAQSTVQKLMAEPMEFYCRVQHYVDSSEKSTGKANDGAKKKKKKRMEFWPLIRVVKIYTKADALATGAVVVDLPGVHDSNAARAAVAQGYIKQCTGLWIVAPINRAVDDKAAKTLLGDSFKRQLKMDGGYSAVSFICSKTDDINVNEASDSLGIKRRIENLWVQADECEENAKKFKKQQSELKDQKKCYGDVMEQMEEEIEAWEMLGERLEKGETVCRPDTGKKRKRSPNEHLDANKRRRGSDSKNSTAQEDEKNAENADHDEGQPTEAAEPLTEEQIDAQIADFKSKKKKSRQERALLEAKLKDIEGEAAKSKTLQTNIEASIRALCIEGRNSYSKGAIQQDFAAGIKELDQENADEDDEENFNPDEDIRDYEEVARHLPVFCCSSRAYQRLMGRFKKEPDVPGFTTIEQTQIPDLQAHCRKLTEAGRSANCKRFLNSLSQLLNSMTLWAGNDKSGANLTPEQKLKEEASLAVNLQKLEEALESNVTSSIKAIRAELEADIFDQFNLAVISSSEQALPTAQKWGFKVNKDDRAAGGYYWATYKAICRRGGVYANPQGSHDFNLFLAEPIVRVLAGGWERCFTRSIPKVYRNFTRSSSESLHKFHSRAEQRSRAAGLNLVGLGLLQQQLQVYENTLNNIGSLMTDQINKQQREINREFTPVIARHMLEAYEGCVAQCGPGSFARMKTLMENHVTAQRITMFHASTQTVHKLLMAMVAQVEEATLNEVEGLLVNLRRDYQTVVGGALLPAGEMLPRHERHLRTDVREILDDYKDTWSNLLEASAENDHKDGNAPAPSDLAGDNRSFEFENFLDDGDFINYNDEEDDAEDNNNEGANKKQAPINFVNDDEEIDAF